jgi:endonuclease III
MNKSKVNSIFEIFSNITPHPKTELEYVNNYTLLVAVVLSAQATDVGVNKATRALFAIVDTPEKMLDLGEYELKQHIKTIGLFNSKAKNVIGLSGKLVNEHNSEVPEDFKKLCALPGVGIKTANVVLNCAFGHPTIAVDTHVFRVSNRLGLVHTKTADETGDKLLKVIPKQWQMHAHHWLILHGRYTCKARKPDCGSCVVAQFCEFKVKADIL